MIKYFCDRCNKESKEQVSIIPIYAYDGLGNKILSLYGKHLCEECCAKLDSIKEQLKHEEDIFDMTDEEIELLRYTFKVGDKVITANGRTGKITGICTCDQCKQRGFYEANIEFNDKDTDYLMISDKKNGFKAYFSIGDRIFGNLDEKSVDKEINECYDRLLQLSEQLGMMTRLKSITKND